MQNGDVSHDKMAQTFNLSSNTEPNEAQVEETVRERKKNKTQELALAISENRESGLSERKLRELFKIHWPTGYCHYQDDKVFFEWDLDGFISHEPKLECHGFFVKWKALEQAKVGETEKLLSLINDFIWVPDAVWLEISCVLRNSISWYKSGYLAGVKVLAPVCVPLRNPWEARTFDHENFLLKEGETLEAMTIDDRRRFVPWEKIIENHMSEKVRARIESAKKLMLERIGGRPRVGDTTPGLMFMFDEYEFCYASNNESRDWGRPDVSTPSWRPVLDTKFIQSPWWNRKCVMRDLIVACASYQFPEVGGNLQISLANALPVYIHLLENDTAGPAKSWFDVVATTLDTGINTACLNIELIKKLFSGTDMLNDGLIAQARIHILGREIGGLIEKNKKHGTMRLFGQYKMAFLLALMCLVIPAEAKKVEQSQSLFWFLIFAFLSMIPWDRVGAFLNELCVKLKRSKRGVVDAVFERVKKETTEFFDVETGFRAEYLVEHIFSSDAENIYETYSKNLVGFPIAFSDLPGSQVLSKFFDGVKTECPGVVTVFTDCLKKLNTEPWAKMLFATILAMCGLLSAVGSKRSRVGTVMNYTSFMGPWLLTAYGLGFFDSASSFKDAFLQKIGFKAETGEFLPGEEWLNSIQDVFHSWKVYRSSPLGQSVNELISFLFAVPLMQLVPKSSSVSSIASWQRSIQAEMLKADCTMVGVMNSFVYVLRTAMALCRTGQLITDLRILRSNTWVLASEYMKKISLGQHNELGVGYRDIENIYFAARDELKHQLVYAIGTHKLALEERMVKINMAIQDLDRNVKMGSYKKQPYSLFLYGGPGVGKSSITASCHRFLNCVRNMPDGKILIKDEGDQYDSSQTEEHTNLTIDDIGMDKTDYKKRSGAQIVRTAVTTLWNYTLQPEADKKGKIMNNIHTVIITSNLEDGGVSKEVVTPGALYRRLGDCVEVTLDDTVTKVISGVRIPDRAAIKRLSDPSKPFQDFQNYRFYRLVERNGNYLRINETEVLKAPEFLAELRKRATYHMEIEEKAERQFASSEHVAQCPHGTWPGYCLECKVEAESDSYKTNCTEAEKIEAKTFMFLEQQCRENTYLWVLYKGIKTFDMLVWFLIIMLMCGLTTSLFYVFGINKYSLLVLIIVSGLLSFVYWDFNNSFTRAACTSLDAYEMVLEEFVTKKNYWCNVVETLIYALAATGVSVMLGRMLQKQFFAEAEVEEFTEVKAEKVEEPREHYWAPVARDSGRRFPTSKGITLEQGIAKLRKARLVGEMHVGNSIVKFKGLLLDSSLLWLPAHAFVRVTSEKEVELRCTVDVDGNGTLFNTGLVKIRMEDVYWVPGKDACIVHLHYIFGDRPSVWKLLPLTPFKGELVHTWVDFDRNFIERRIDVTGKASHLSYRCESKLYSSSEGYIFNIGETTKYGNCGTYGVSRTKEGFCLLGMYTAGDGLEQNGYATILTAQDYKTALEWFVGKGYVPSVEITHIDNQVAGYLNKEVEVLHKKNPINFVTANSPNLVSVVEKKNKPRSNMRVTPFAHTVSEVFGVPINYKPPALQECRSLHPFLEEIHTTKTTVKTEAFNLAKQDMLDMVDTLCENLQADLSADRLSLLAKPFDEELILKGLPGEPLVKALNANTSAGSPFNTLKNKVLDLDDDGHLMMTDELGQHLDRALVMLSEDVHPGSYFDSQLKDESRKLDKQVDRVFQISPLVSTILVKRYFDPMLNAMDLYPVLTECALGCNPYGKKWNQLWTHMYSTRDGAPPVFSDEDFKGYDTTMQCQLRAVVVELLLRFVGNMSWNKSDTDMLRKVASGCYLNILVNVCGAIICNNNFQPSGTTSTGRSNSLVNSLIQRILWYQQNPHLKFSDYVRLVTLGDDMVKSMSSSCEHLFDLKKKVEDAATFGIVITSSDKNSDALHWKKLDEPWVFLQRSVFYNEDLQSIVGVLHRNSLLRPFFVADKTSLSDPNYLGQLGDNLLRESFLAGREEFEWIRAKLMVFFSSIGYVTDFGVMSQTYDQLVDQFLLENERHQCPRYVPKRAFRQVLLSNFVAEGLDALEANKVATHVFGKHTPDPNLIYRMVGGERILSYAGLLKAYSVAGHIDQPLTPEKAVTTGVIYGTPGEGDCTLWSSVIGAFNGVGGSVAMNFHVIGNGYLLIYRGHDEVSNANLTNPAGCEILDTRVNPNMTVVFPGPRDVRWFQVHGFQPVTKIPLYSVEAMGMSKPIDPEASTKVRIAAGEDFLLLGYRGPRLLYNAAIGGPRKTRGFKAEVEVVGLTGFAQTEQENLEGAPLVGKTDPTMVGAQRQLDAENWFERCVWLDTIAFSQDQYVSVTMQPVFEFFNSNFVRQRTCNVAYFSGTCVLRVEVPGGLMFAGKLLMSVITPNLSADTERLATRNDAVCWMRLTSMNHVFVDLGTPGFVDLEIPFVYFNNLARLAEVLTPTLDPLSSSAYNPVVLIKTVVPLLSGSNSTDNTFLSFHVYFKNLVLTGATGLYLDYVPPDQHPALPDQGYERRTFEAEGEAPIEKPSSVASALANKLYSFAEIMDKMNVPMLAVPAEVGGLVFEGISGVARHFGHSRPVDARMSSFIPVTSTSMTSYDSDNHARTLALSNSYGTSIDAIIGGLGKRSECEFHDKWPMKVLLTVIPWPVSGIGYNSPLEWISVGPQFVTSVDGYFALSPHAHICTFFRNWCGSIKYNFEVVAPSGYSGVLEIVYEPNPEYVNTIWSFSQTNQSVRFDITETKEVEIVVKWESDKVGLLTYGDTLTTPLGTSSYNSLCHNGVILVRVMNDLTCSFSPDPSGISILVWGSVVPEEIAVWDFYPRSFEDVGYFTGGPVITSSEAYTEATAGSLSMAGDGTSVDEGSYIQLGGGGSFLGVTPPIPVTPRPPGPPVSQPTQPMKAPTLGPAPKGSSAPVQQPVAVTRNPTKIPSFAPVYAPSRKPTRKPTRMPTIKPTSTPVSIPILSPTMLPTKGPTKAPTGTVVTMAPTSSCNQVVRTIPPAVLLGTDVSAGVHVHPDFTITIPSGTNLVVPYTAGRGKPVQPFLYFDVEITTTSPNWTVSANTTYVPGKTIWTANYYTDPAPFLPYKTLTLKVNCATVARCWRVTTAVNSSDYHFIKASSGLMRLGAQGAGGTPANASFTNGLGETFTCATIANGVSISTFNGGNDCVPPNYPVTIIYEGGLVMNTESRAGGDGTGNLPITTDVKAYTYMCTKPTGISPPYYTARISAGAAVYAYIWPFRMLTGTTSDTQVSTVYTGLTAP